jgi:ElaB/YqjD/DUF883 family membrane-anchored ribosome-binding protein
MAEPNLERLECQAEQSRADFSNTVDELRSRVSGTADDLRERVSPDNLKHGIKQYVESTSQEMLSNLRQRASENPLQAVAIGAGVAYVGWRFLRTIPMPLLLLGAGIAMIRPSGRAGAARRDASDLGNGDFDTAEQHAGTFERAQSAVASGAEAAAGRVGKTLSGTGEAAGRMASAATSGVSDAASTVYRSGKEAASYAGGQAAQAGQKTRESAVATFEEHPLLVGGIGVAIGAFIAACIPATEAENRLLGAESDDLKNRASRAASEGYEAAKSAGQRVYEETRREATDPQNGGTAEENPQSSKDRSTAGGDGAPSAGTPDTRPYQS